MVRLDNVSKVYPLYQHASQRLLESLPFAPRLHSEFAAVRNVSFEIGTGETFALVGPNGSGKSTLLQLIAGILEPTSGRLTREGRVAALLELGAGFNPEFTGRENVYLTGELQGFERSDTERRIPEILEFAGIGDFFDRPVKEYSSGMYVRLAFASAVHVDPEILIVDEALAVGDVRFANRCIRKFEEFRERRKTILFVSHDLGLVKRLADRAALLMAGSIEMIGAPAEVVNRYVGLVLGGESEARDSAGHGDGASRIESVRLLNADRRELSAVASGTIVLVEVAIEIKIECERLVVGLLIRNRLGIDVFGTNTRIEGLQLGPFDAGNRVAITFRFRCHLTRQDYTLTVATQHESGASQDWRDDILTFSVIDSREHAGVANLGAEIEWRRL